MPVTEALLDERATLTRLVLARNARGEAVDRIRDLAARRGVAVERVDASRVTRLSGNGRHDQGVVARVESPGLCELEDWLGRRPAGAPMAVLLLDGLTNPANIGMIIRSAVAAGLDGIVLPRAGSPDVGPLVVKASAGIALFAPVLRSPTAVAAAGLLARSGAVLIGLRATAPTTIWEMAVDRRSVFVLGNETLGISEGVSGQITQWASVPLCGGVESLNVATAGTLVAFEVARRRAGR
ncbi:MAG: RNA methyltransferase [Acidimicrobiales bacterium]